MSILFIGVTLSLTFGLIMTSSIKWQAMINNDFFLDALHIKRRKVLK